MSIHETRDPFFSRLFRAKSTSFCYLVWLGRFVPEKGVDLVIEVEKDRHPFSIKKAEKLVSSISCILQMNMLLSPLPTKEHRTHESLIIVPCPQTGSGHGGQK